MKPATEVDVVVVGAGPAGLTAAAELAETGLRVVVLDENTTPGGQYLRRRSGTVLAELGDFRPEGTALVARAEAAGVRIELGTGVWGVDDDGRTLLTVDAGGAAGAHLGRAVVVATGAHERSLPFPGWELPGVVTPGAALHLATLDGVAVGERVVVAGGGPFLLPVACALLDVGARVLGVFEAGAPYRLHPQAAAHPAQVREFARYRWRLARARVPVLSRWRIREATGLLKVETVQLEHASEARRRVRVDALAVAHGFRPNTELAVLLGAAPDPASPEGRGVIRDRFGRTTRDGVVVAGESAGVAGVHAARARGVLAAHAVAQRLGKDGPSPRTVRYALRTARRAESFAAFTHRIFPVDPGRILARVPDPTLVCRCEGVTAGDLRGAHDLAVGDPGAAKALTRAGMGPCQGRQCGEAVAALLGSSSAFTPRMPIKPVPVDALLDTGEER